MYQQYTFRSTLQLNGQENLDLGCGFNTQPGLFIKGTLLFGWELLSFVLHPWVKGCQGQGSNPRPPDSQPDAMTIWTRRPLRLR